MDPLSLMQLAFQFGTTIKAIIDAATSNDDIVTKITNVSKPLATVLEGIGGQMFPQAKPQLKVAAAAMAAFDPNVTKWLQGSLNVLVSPSPNLVVDGIYGPKTKAAVTQLQTDLGLAVDGWAGQVTQAAITAALTRLNP